MVRTFTIDASKNGAAVPFDLKQDLNDAQRAAVTCGDGPKLVIAGAGSGKTRTITYRVAYLITRGLQPSQVFLATFTNKAAREMLSRVAARTGSRTGTGRERPAGARCRTWQARRAARAGGRTARSGATPPRAGATRRRSPARTRTTRRRRRIPSPTRRRSRHWRRWRPATTSSWRTTRSSPARRRP